MADFPMLAPEVLAFVRERHGEPVSVDRLSGMSVASVYRVRFAGGSLVAKVSRRPGEAAFYGTIAPRLAEGGVNTPTVEWQAELLGDHWIVMEDVSGRPAFASAEAWQPHPGVMAMLARLHRFTRDAEIDYPWQTSTDWTTQISEAAASSYSESERPRVFELLERFRAESPEGETYCWISGDTSPPNWGERANGDLVLFDWELFRQGMPAGDLAPAVPGLPGSREFSAAARAYASAWRDLGEELPWTVARLERDIAVAKVRTLVVLLAAHMRGLARVPDDYVASLVARTPEWLDGLAN